MIEKHISINFQGRYYSIGGTDSKKSTAEIWFVLHGQGQLAKYFIQKFSSIATEDRRIIAPEGLSRYYLDNFNGRVGATWMTREDRLIDISNYLTFLSAVYQQEIVNAESSNITLLGFSQGAATASRWVLSDDVKFNRLILWGGLFPQDMDFQRGHDKMKDLEILSVVGDSDEYLNDVRRNELFQIATKLDISYSTRTFHGGHEIHQDTLLGLV